VISRLFLLLILLLPAHATRQSPAPPYLVTLQVPDARVARAWPRAQHALDGMVTGDVAIISLARAATGQLGHIRTAVTAATQFTPASLLALHAYWTASGDDAFLRAKWGKASAAFAGAAGNATSHEPGLWLATVDAVLAMSRTLGDAATRAFAEQAYRTAEVQIAQQLSLFALALGLYSAERADTLLAGALPYIHALWPLGSGLASLAFYEYHQDSTAFALLERMMQHDSIAAPMVVLPLLRGLVGWETDAANNAAALEPHMPATWTSMSVGNLPIGANRVDATLRRERGSYTIHLQRRGTGPPMSIRVAPALPTGTRVRAVTVNERDVPVHIDASEHDVHVVIETSLTREVQIDIEYDAPRRRASARR
jgi:hypothetical protein